MELKLSERSRRFLEAEIASSRYSSPEEIVEAALDYWSVARPDQIEIIDPETGRVRSEEDVAAMVQAGLDEEAAGLDVEVDLDDYLQEVRQRLHDRAAM